MAWVKVARTMVSGLVNSAQLTLRFIRCKNTYKVMPMMTTETGRLHEMEDDEHEPPVAISGFESPK
jgi:hypothetical protein